MLDQTLLKIKKMIPPKVFELLQPIYHFKLALIGAIIYCFPSRHIKVIGVTGTKGKSTTVEIINAIIEKAGYKTALSNTIRYKVGNDPKDSHENLFKMSMPGRFFVQKLIRSAVRRHCEFVIIEMTSQGALNFRHKFISLDALVFTNLSPEHIEAHGSYEKYVDAKLSIAREMKNSLKRPRSIIVNADDPESEKFIETAKSVGIENIYTYSIDEAKPYNLGGKDGKGGIDMTLDGKSVKSPLSGLFNLSNILAGRAVAKAIAIDEGIIEEAIGAFAVVKGRVERIDAGQDFSVIVDYAHTPDSLSKLYGAFPNQRKICVLGGTGGGRDTWKRAEMGKIASENCAEIILTNEDPYDEDPMVIINHVKEGVEAGGKSAKIILDRREAIRTAFSLAKKGDAVLISGKGTDPFIMGPDGSKIPWSDAQVSREELEKN